MPKKNLNKKEEKKERKKLNILQKKLGPEKKKREKNGIGAIIHIGREIQCLPYAGFKKKIFCTIPLRKHWQKGG